MSIKNYDFTDLEAAVAYAATPPFGAWRVEFEGGDLYLIWECKEADWPEEEFIVRNWPEDAYGDEPLVDWGGDAIIAAAGIGRYDDAGIDSDDGSVTHWARWSRDDHAAWIPPQQQPKRQS